MNAIAQQNRYPVSTRWKHVLSRDVAAGDTVIASNDRLIPAKDCRSIIEEMDALMTPCTAEQAVSHARIILAAYGAQKPDDPDNYVRLVTMAVSACPPDLLVKLVDEVPRRHPRFLPSKGEVDAVVTDLTAKRTAAKSVAHAHLREHAKRHRESAEAQAAKHAKWEAGLTDDQRARLAEVRRRRDAGESVADMIPPVDLGMARAQVQRSGETA